MKSSVDKRSVSIAGRSTSVSLEKLFWDCLQEIAEERRQSLRQLIASIDADRKEGNLSSAIRLFVLHDYQHRTLKRSRRGARPSEISDRGRPVAIVSVWGPEHRLTRERLPEVGRRTLEAAHEIKELLR